MASAQQAPAGQQAAAPTNYKVGKITIKFLGTANVSEDVVRANIQVHEGGTLDDTMIDRDIRALYKTSLFEFIEVKREAAGDNVYNLVFEVTPKYRVLAIRYVGNKQVKVTRLEKEVKSRPNTALDERQIKEDSEKIRDYYQKAGYNQVSVNYTIERDRSTGFGTVIFNIHEGNKVKIAAILFVGNDHIKVKKLRGEMTTRKWWMFSWLTGHGRFKDDEFDDDLDKLRDFYREAGFLDVEIPQEEITFDYPSKDKLVITIHVHEGRQYHIGDITFVGCKIYPATLLKRVARQKSGMIFTPSKLDKDVERLEDFYGSAGYLETRVRMLRKPNIETGNIDIEYQVNESEKFNVESIRIEGNSKTKSIVILRELVLGPGDVFDTVRMKISKLRLENTRFFDDVQMSPQETNIPGRRDLRVAVHEARTGNLTFGAGYSSVERATIFAELSQSNFDLFNRRSFFQGDGEKFRLRIQVGTLSSDMLLAFDEPWLFQRQLAAGFSIFRSSSDYTSTYYQQVSTGAEVHLRKRLFELVDGQVSYTYQVVNISNVDPSVAFIIPSGTTRISSVGFQLVRDTRDKIISTTSGNRIELDTTVAGGPFGAGTDFYKLEFRGAQFYPVFDLQNQVLSVIGRAGTTQSYGQTATVPYYELFYLGGPNTLRGFQYNDVSPRNSLGYLLGGKSYGFFSLEYSMDVVSPIRVAAFYDAGFVNTPTFDFNPADLHDDVGVGIQLFVAGSPLRLDYAIPLTGNSAAKKGGQFNFSFGTRF